MNIDEKDSAINEIIIDLSKQVEKDDLDRYIIRFETIYANDYRHSYAKMYGTIAEVQERGNIDFLSTNIELLREHANSLDNDKISVKTKQGINKFFDHVSLECARLLHFGIITNKYQQVDSCYQKWLQDSKEFGDNIEAQNKALDDVQGKINNQNKEILSHMISIVSIFTAVVFTALTSFNLITSIASAVVEKNNYYWIGCVLATVAFITINLFYILLKFISRLIDKAIFAHKHYIMSLDLVLGLIIVILFILANRSLHIYPS